MMRFHGFSARPFGGVFRTRDANASAPRTPCGPVRVRHVHLLMNVLHRELSVSARSLALKREQNLLIAHTMLSAACVCWVGSAWGRDRTIDFSRLEIFGGRHRRRQCYAWRAAARTAARY